VIELKIRHKGWRLIGRKEIAVAALMFLLLAATGTGFGAAAPDGGVESTVAGAGSSWLRVRMNLSGSASVDSGYPDIAADSSGDYVAIVWSEGYDSSEGAKHHGRIYLRWIAEGTGQWSQKIVVDDGTNGKDDWSREAVVTLERDAGSGTVTAHVAWVRFEKQYGWTLRYRTCVLGGSCGTVRKVDGPYAEAYPLQVPDIAVGGNGTPIVVWLRKIGTQQQAAYYAEFNGSTWSSKEISTPGTNNEGPVVAVKGDTAYAAWVRMLSGQRRVKFSKKSVGGAWLAEREDVYYTSMDLWHPFLAADDSAVYLAWETEISDPDYQVNYKYDTGSGWRPSDLVSRYVITNSCRATTSGVADPPKNLRPALAVGSSGLYAVWHHNYYVPPVNEGDDPINMHRVLYSYSGNPRVSTPSWSEPAVFATLSADEAPFSQDNVATRIAVGPPRVGEIEPHLHVVLMLKTGSAWDVWYLSNQVYRNTALPLVAKN